MIDENDINERFGNSGNVHNPIFKDTIKDLMAAGLYNVDYFYLSGTPFTKEEIAIRDIQEKTVFCYTNPDGDPGSVSMDVLVHAITKNVLLGLQKGFNQMNKTKDAASNISYSTLDTQKLTLTNLSLSNAKDVNQAIYILAQEISNIKNTLGVVDPTAFPTPTNPNKLSL